MTSHHYPLPQSPKRHSNHKNSHSFLLRVVVQTVLPCIFCFGWGVQFGMHYNTNGNGVDLLRSSSSSPSRSLSRTLHCSDGSSPSSTSISSSSSSAASVSSTFSTPDTLSRTKNLKQDDKKKKQQRKNDFSQRFHHLFSWDKHQRIQIREVALMPNANTTDANDVPYPFIPKWIRSQCGVPTTTKENIESSTEMIRLGPLNRSLAFIRPHKTGSTTIKGVVQRITFGRGGIEMISADKTYLGWPNRFPGSEVVGLQDVLRTTKYDSFSHHSVLAVEDPSIYKQYLKEPVCVFTILREPLSRTISAFHFFGEDDDDFDSWRDFLDKYQQQTQVKGWKPAVYMNNLAFSLGWYHQAHIGGLTAHDHNRTLIRDFIKKVDKQLDFVMILEHMVESLVLWKDLAVPELQLEELVWYDANTEHKPSKIYPTDSEQEELKQMLLLDTMIYNHFKRKMEKQWDDAIQRSPKLQAMKESLKCMHNTIVRALEEEEKVEEDSGESDDNSDSDDSEEDTELSFSQTLPAKLNEFLTLPAVRYTQAMRSRQLDQYGCDHSTECP